jgi:peroxiredoxin Q/BCP
VNSVSIRIACAVLYSATAIACQSSAAAAVREAQTELQPGALVPEQPAVLQDGFRLFLRALKGKLIAVYFCDSVESAACVREAEGWRDNWNELHEGHHVVMLGVTPQSAATHSAFIEQHKLQFDLASDADHRLAKAFGVRSRIDASPRVFLIDKDSKILSVWRTADPDAHAQAMLAAAAE